MGLLMIHPLLLNLGSFLGLGVAGQLVCSIYAKGGGVLVTMSPIAFLR